MTGSVMLIAGQSGAKSTFAGGFLHYAEKMRGYNVVDSVAGNERDYEQSVINKMFAQGEYPDQTRDGYIANYELNGKAFSRPGMEIDIVDFPGEGLESAMQSAGKDPLMLRIRQGRVDDPETVRKEYKQNILPDFRRGNGPNNPDDWETTFLHHYYQADKAIFLMNLFKVTEDDDKELMYDKKAIEHANEQFSDVAVVPIAVDLFGYDPETYDPGFLRRMTNQILRPARRDTELMSHLDGFIDRSSTPRANQIVNYVDGNGELDFFSVSVPDKGTPNSIDDKLTGDGSGGFVVKGFGEVVAWLER
jgi:hypothetical protein